MNNTIGVFLSDIHFPENISLKPVLHYIKHLYKQCSVNKNKFLIILGGDIIDAKDMYGIESMQASQIKLEWYERDCKLILSFVRHLLDIAPKAELVYLEGNHEDRYSRTMRRYPDAWGSRFDFNRDVITKVFPKAEWIPYGSYHSYFKLGDCYFIHGTWPLPDHHSKKIALNHTPYKVGYGHMHTWQATTIHNAISDIPARYAVTAGCLCHLAPEWKKGSPHQWICGFLDFVSIKGTTTLTAHVIEKGRFQVGGKLYE
jgi:hypothetical protein